MPRILFGALGALLLANVALNAQQAPLTVEQAVTRAMTSGPGAQAASGMRATISGRARADAQWANPTLELRRENEGAPIPYDDFATLTLPVSFTGRRAALRDASAAARLRSVAEIVADIANASGEPTKTRWRRTH